MSRCSYCNGTGYVRKHRNCLHSTYEAYINGCNDQIVCKQCKGYGTVYLDLVKDILKEIVMNGDRKSSISAKEALKQWNLIEHE
ncbi:MAG: hypothetical protein WC516_08485 [Patescibacteria group bacterium]|jgi:RecJ-like exonuclease